LSIRVYIDGEIHDEKTAVVPVFDRGFLYGDSVYEVTRTVAGRPLDLDRHLDRLDRSSVQIGIPIFPRKDLHRAVAQTLSAAGNPDSYIRVIVTRGAGELNLDPAAADRPRLIVLVKDLRLPSDEDYERGVDVALVGVVRNARRAVDPAVKSGNYLNNILAIAEARRRGAYEAFMLNAEGRLVEGSTCNVFVVTRGIVRTPAFEDGLLDGITRHRILELCAGAGIIAEESHLGAADLVGADEAFLSSSIRGVVPVVSESRSPIGDGRPGPVTRKVMELYARHLREVAVSSP
jgi:branched-chain amino acid aminotransferase